MLESERRVVPETAYSVDDKSCFKEIFHRLEQANLDYRIVGSTAVAAYLGEGANVEIRDVDVICFAVNAADVRTLQSDLDKDHTRSNGRLLRVDLSAVISQGDGESTEMVDQPIFLPKLLVNIGRNKDGYYLVYNNSRNSIKNDVMQPIALPFRGTTIKTIPPETLLHLYITRRGCLRPKDISKVRGLARHCKHYPTEGLGHSDFEVFHRFAARMRSDYPWQISLYRILTQIDHLCGGKISKNYLVAKK